MSETCGTGGKTRYYYTGNQVGDLNHVGDYNFVAGGPPGSGISAGVLVPVFFPPPVSRAPWENVGAVLNQELLDASFPFINLNFIADIYIDDEVFRVSDRNVYVQEKTHIPRFYEARVKKAPVVSISLGEWLQPNFEVADMKIVLNNRDGFFNRLLPQGEEYKSWTSSRVEIRVGFGEKFENYYLLFEGFIAAKQGVTTSDTDVTVKCYDKFDRDEIPIPATLFSSFVFPDLQDGVNGKSVPMVYGDWSTEVGSYGEIPAYCINANEPGASSWLFKISENPLKEIGDVFIHRSPRVATSVDGPIKVDPNYVYKFPENGEFVIDGTQEVLAEWATVMDRTQAGSGSGLNLVTSDAAGTDFITKGVAPGDKVIKTKTSEEAEVIAVASNQLTLIGGVTFAQNDEYAVRTKYFRFRKQDKITVLCKGKNIQNMSLNRLSDAGLLSVAPEGLTMGLNGTFWFVDNTLQKIFEINLKNIVERVIDFSAIDASLTKVSGLSLQTDNTLWLFNPINSTIYRFLLDDMSLGLMLPTTSVVGLLAPLGNGAGLSIDTGNLIYLVDNDNGQFYVINPFDVPSPSVLYTWNRTAFDPAANECLDLSIDVNLLNLVVVDRQTQKFYRINRTTGALISSENLSVIDVNATWVTGVSSAQDGTLFFMNRQDNTLYNYNEDQTSIDNVGFQCRDIIQTLAGRTSNEFDLIWNQVCREYLSQFKSRLYVDDKSNCMTYVNKVLAEYNVAMFITFTRYAIYPIEFDWFRTDGKIINEGDIKADSFNANKEYSQYFNSAFSEYNRKPFSNEKTVSDTYLSISGIAFAGREVSKKFEMKTVYRRADIDFLVPLMVRLSATEPEFIELECSWRRLFTQPMAFLNLDFAETANCLTGKKLGGRRWPTVPMFTRKIEFDLDRMTLKMKLWSLGTTAFGSYVPVGPYAGGENDKIILSALGRIGYVSPKGDITAATTTQLTIADVGGADAQTRTASVIGLAWKPGYKIAVVNAATALVAGIAEIGSVSGQIITLVSPLSFTPTPVVLNSAGFPISGHYIRYADYEETTVAQKDNYSHFGPPEVGYPTTGYKEVTEQKTGLHNLTDGRLPYILFPKDFTP